MQAIVLSAYGDAHQLKLQERPEPEPGAGQIKVKVLSSSVNPVDWKLRSGALKAAMPLELPVILGRDAAGEVVKVGAGVQDFRVGDRVFGLVHGSYAQFVVAPVAAWAKIPEGLDTDAGALPLVSLTGEQLAAAALTGISPSGATVLVTGAIGAVGRVAVWGIRQRGARVIAGVRGKQVDEAKKLGAAEVVALDDDAALERLPPLDAIADTVGGETVQRLLPKLKAKGSIGSVVGEPKGAKDRGFTVHAFMAQPDRAGLEKVARAVARGELSIPIAKRFALEDIAQAHELAERGGVGKILLLPFGS